MPSEMPEQGIRIQDLLDYAGTTAWRSVALFKEGAEAARALKTVAQATGGFSQVFNPSQFVRHLNTLSEETTHSDERNDRGARQVALIAALIGEYQTETGTHLFPEQLLRSATQHDQTAVPFSPYRTELLTTDEGLQLISRLADVGKLSPTYRSKALRHFRDGPRAVMGRPTKTPRLSFQYLVALRLPDAKAGQKLSGAERSQRSIVASTIGAMASACPDAVPSPFAFNPRSSRKATGADLANFAGYLKTQRGWSDAAAWYYQNAVQVTLSNVTKFWASRELTEELLINAWRSVDDMDLSRRKKSNLRAQLAYIATELSTDFPDRGLPTLDERSLSTDLQRKPLVRDLIAATYHARDDLGETVSARELEKLRSSVRTVVDALNGRPDAVPLDLFTPLSDEDIDWVESSGMSESTIGRFRRALRFHDRLVEQRRSVETEIPPDEGPAGEPNSASDDETGRPHHHLGARERATPHEETREEGTEAQQTDAPGRTDPVHGSKIFDSSGHDLHGGPPSQSEISTFRITEGIATAAFGDNCTQPLYRDRIARVFVAGVVTRDGTDETIETVTQRFKAALYLANRAGAPQTSAISLANGRQIAHNLANAVAIERGLKNNLEQRLIETVPQALEGRTLR